MVWPEGREVAGWAEKWSLKDYGLNIIPEASFETRLRFLCSLHWLLRVFLLRIENITPQQQSTFFWYVHSKITNTIVFHSSFFFPIWFAGKTRKENYAFYGFFRSNFENFGYVSVMLNQNWHIPHFEPNNTLFGNMPAWNLGAWNWNSQTFWFTTLYLGTKTKQYPWQNIKNVLNPYKWDYGYQVKEHSKENQLLIKPTRRTQRGVGTTFWMSEILCKKNSLSKNPNRQQSYVQDTGCRRRQSHVGLLAEALKRGNTEASVENKIVDWSETIWMARKWDTLAKT